MAGIQEYSHSFTLIMAQTDPTDRIPDQSRKMDYVEHPDTSLADPPEPDDEENHALFGRFDYPCRYERAGISFCIEREGDLIMYRRQCGSSNADKIISSSAASLFVHPVEPVNLPKEVTRFLEIEFPPVMMAPESVKTLFLTFPVEIGVILKMNDDYRLLDVFSLVAPKYSLYGPPDSGIITRYYHSNVSDHIPDTDPAETGILQMMIHNSSKGWVDVARVVLEAYSMPIYFGAVVAMSAHMEIFSKEIAETRVLERPIISDMNLAIPVIYSRKILLIDTERKRFLMEYGVR
jgi:hypothetical protein